MSYLIQSFWEICLLQKAPQDIPYSRGLLFLLLPVNFLVGTLYLVFSSLEVGLGSILLFASIHMLFFLGSLSVLMLLMGYAARIVQTLVALLGTDIIITLLAMPVVMAINNASELAGYFGIILLLLITWNLVIMAHILRHALSVSFLLAGLIAFGYFMLSIKLVDSFLPATG
jgi:hypothetical protein